jgi:hypothetical protein
VLAPIERQGAEFFRLASLNEPCGVDGVIQVPQYPIINCTGCPNCAPGTFDVAVTPDGHYAFVANEYGQLPSPTPTPETGGGTIGVIKVERTVLVDLRDKASRAIQHHIHTGWQHYPGNNVVARRQVPFMSRAKDLGRWQSGHRK